MDLESAIKASVESDIKRNFNCIVSDKLDSAFDNAVNALLLSGWYQISSGVVSSGSGLLYYVMFTRKAV